MTKSIGAGVLAVLCAALAAGCTKSDLDVVKGSAMPGDSSTTVEKALSRIPSCKEIQWRESRTAKGAVITASCQIGELRGVRETVASRLREFEQDAVGAFEQRRATRAGEIRKAIREQRRIKAEIDDRTVTELRVRENVRVGGVSDCAFYTRVSEILGKSIQADERRIAEECAKGKVECTAARAVYEPRINQHRQRLARVSEEQASCVSVKAEERERVQALNERYAADARSQREAKAKDSKAAADKISALERELSRTLKADSDEALERDRAAIARLRPSMGLERLAVEFEFALNGKGKTRAARLSAVVSEFTWPGADTYGVRHGGRALPKYGEDAVLRDVLGGKSLWDCMTSPASAVGCRVLSEEILSVYRERFSIPKAK